jgi:hypothetical protein
MQFPIEIDKFKHPPTYKTDLGAAFCGDSLDLLNELPDESINLVITSPPFALQREKEYRSIVNSSINRRQDLSMLHVPTNQLKHLIH